MNHMTEVDYMTLRLRILEYIKNNEDANFFQMSKELNLGTDVLARELKTLKDRECVTVYKRRFLFVNVRR